jgi:predicted AlkP superfamily pyrophosphatase or phosphodiesterase
MSRHTAATGAGPLALLAVLLLATTGCDLSEAPGPTPPGNDLKVLVIGLDGLRGDAVPATDTPGLDALMEQGAWTLSASTQLQAPTVSGPGWTSILTGVDADKHLIVSNGGYDDIDRAFPTFLGRAHELGLPTATAIHWLPIQVNIIEDEVVDDVMIGTDAQVADLMSDVLETGDLDVHFVHLDDIDGAGHSDAFSPESASYLETVRITDGYVAQLTDAIAARDSRSDEQWLVVVTSDHGGLGSSHGGTEPEIRAVPLIIWGDGVVAGEFSGGGVVPGELDSGFVSHLDVHPTVMQHLGFPPEAGWNLDGEVRGLAVTSP